jgi:hypothetical protein
LNKEAIKNLPVAKEQPPGSYVPIAMTQDIACGIPIFIV